MDNNKIKSVFCCQFSTELVFEFDPDLNIEIMISQTKRRLDGMIKGMPPVLFKDFTVTLLIKTRKSTQKGLRMIMNVFA